MDLAATVLEYKRTRVGRTIPKRCDVDPVFVDQIVVGQPGEEHPDVGRCARFVQVVFAAGVELSLIHI